MAAKEKEVRIQGANGSAEPFADFPETGKNAILSMAPESPERIAMLKLIATLEKRYSRRPPGGGGGGGGGGGDGDNPIPKYAQQTRQVIDFLKYVGLTVFAISALGWMGRDYVSGFQTSAEASESQRQIEASLSSVNEAVLVNDEAIGGLRVSGVQIMLEQRNANDRLDQILELQTAQNSRTGRRAAQETVADIQRRIDRRRRLQRNEVRLRDIAEQLQDDPLGGLEGL